MKKKKNQKTLRDPFEFNPEDKLDYHELGILDRFDIEKILEEFIEDSYINQYARVLIITGKGKVVRPIVESALKSNKFVKKFKTAGYFNGQQGAFEVELSA